MVERFTQPCLFLLAVVVPLLAASEVHAFGRCTDAGYLAGFDPRLGRASCRVMHSAEIRWREGRAPLRVIATGETPSLDEAEREFVARVDELTAPSPSRRSCSPTRTRSSTACKSAPGPATTTATRRSSLSVSGLYPLAPSAAHTRDGAR